MRLSSLPGSLFDRQTMALLFRGVPARNSFRVMLSTVPSLTRVVEFGWCVGVFINLQSARNKLASNYSQEVRTNTIRYGTVNMRES